MSVLLTNVPNGDVIAVSNFCLFLHPICSFGKKKKKHEEHSVILRSYWHFSRLRPSITPAGCSPRNYYISHIFWTGNSFKTFGVRDSIIREEKKKQSESIQPFAIIMIPRGALDLVFGQIILLGIKRSDLKDWKSIFYKHMGYCSRSS